MKDLDSDFMRILNEVTLKVGKKKPSKERFMNQLTLKKESIKRKVK